MFNILIFLDTDHVEDCLDLEEVAHKFSKEDETVKLYGLGINLKNQKISGLDYLIDVQEEATQSYDIARITEIIAQVQQHYQFDSILILADSLGRMLAPRLAMRLGTGLVADITDVELTKEERLLVRPAFSGKRLASIACHGRPIMASVHPGAFHRVADSRIAQQLTFVPENLKESAIKVYSSVKKQEIQDISNSEVIVSGGVGILKDFTCLNELAYLLHGQVAASKKAVDAGVAMREIQIGQSGKTVHPALYINFGISGTLQHVVGLKDVDTIISVNTNPNAPICALSRIVVKGDAAEFAEKLINKIKNNNA